MTSKQIYDAEKEKRYQKLCDIFYEYAEEGDEWPELRDDIDSALDATGWKP